MKGAGFGGFRKQNLRETVSMEELKEAPGQTGWYFNEDNRILYIQPGGSSREDIVVEISADL